MGLIYRVALDLSQAMQAEERGRRTGRWKREDGKKVADFLAQKSLLKTSTFEGAVF